MLFRSLRFWYYRRTHDFVPSPAELLYGITSVGVGGHTDRECTILVKYCLRKMSLEDIAKDQKVTRERIRQVLMKCNRKFKVKNKWTQENEFTE